MVLTQSNNKLITQMSLWGKLFIKYWNYQNYRGSKAEHLKK